MDLKERLIKRWLPDRIEPQFGAFLAGYVKQGVELGTDELRCYALDIDVRLNGSNFGQRFKERYFDTMFNFCLVFEELLVASLGFDVDDTEMVIWQIQGVKGAGRYLRPLKWARALVEFAVGWARKNGMSMVAIASVSHNCWAAEHAHLDPERGRLLYDVTARRCGFRLAGDGYYMLALEPS